MFFQYIKISKPKEIEIKNRACKRKNNERNRKTKNIIRKTRKSTTFKRNINRKTRKIRYRNRKNRKSRIFKK